MCLDRVGSLAVSAAVTRSLVLRLLVDVAGPGLVSYSPHSAEVRSLSRQRFSKFCSPKNRSKRGVLRCCQDAHLTFAGYDSALVRFAPGILSADRLRCLQNGRHTSALPLERLSISKTLYFGNQSHEPAQPAGIRQMAY
jgi:hypothetical protein